MDCVVIQIGERIETSRIQVTAKRVFRKCTQYVGTGVFHFRLNLGQINRRAVAVGIELATNQLRDERSLH